MPELRTDDGPRKLRAVWLGPKGATLPFEWTYVQWAATLLMIPVGVGLVAALIAVGGVLTIGHAPWFTFWFGLIYGAPLAIYLTVRLMRNVTFDEPLRYKLGMFSEEFGTSARERAETATDWVMPWPRLADLPESTEALFHLPSLAVDLGAAPATDSSDPTTDDHPTEAVPVEAVPVEAVPVEAADPQAGVGVAEPQAVR